MRFRTNKPYYSQFNPKSGEGFAFGVVYRKRTVQAIGDNNERLMLRGWFYYVLPDGRLHYEIHPKSKKVYYKEYFVTSSKAMKNHKFIKYKEFEKLLILFGPENKKMAPNAGEEIPTPEANNSQS